MTTSKELTLPQRAAVALGTAEHEVKLIALAKESTDITAVIDPAGRDQAHRIGMTLRAARTNITKTGKAARDDATAFGKAVIAEEKRLVAIIEPEEARVIALRDAFDAKMLAEKDAKIAAEWSRVDAIKSDIQSIRNLAINAVGKPSKIIKAVIDSLDAIDESESRFAEFVPDAHQAICETLDSLVELHNSTIDSEAAEAKAKADREELAAAQAKLKADQDAAAAEQAALRAEIEKNAAIECAAIAEQQRIAKAAQHAAKAEQDRIAAEHAQKMAEQQAAMDARQRDMDHTEGLMLNAQFYQLAAARKLEEETAAVAVVETPQPAPAIYVGWQPSDDEIIALISEQYGISAIDAIDRLSDIDFVSARSAAIFKAA